MKHLMSQDPVAVEIIDGCLETKGDAATGVRLSPAGAMADATIAIGLGYVDAGASDGEPSEIVGDGAGRLFHPGDDGGLGESERNVVDQQVELGAFHENRQSSLGHLGTR